MCKRVTQKPPQDHLFEVTLYVITNPINMGNFTVEERCRLSHLRVVFMYMGDLFKTCFGRKGPSAVNTYIKITKKSCWVVSGLYLNGILFLN